MDRAQRDVTAGPRRRHGGRAATGPLVRRSRDHVDGVPMDGPDLHLPTIAQAYQNVSLVLSTSPLHHMAEDGRINLPKYRHFVAMACKDFCGRRSVRAPL